MYSLYETESGGYCIINDKSRFMLNSTEDKYSAVLVCSALNEGVLTESEVNNTNDINKLIELYKKRVHE